MFLTASRIHDGKRFLPKGVVLEVNDDGTILGIYENSAGKPVIEYEGWLCPGFINAHCHLELSHLKSSIPKHTRLIPFLKKVVSERQNFSDEEKAIARKEAYNALVKNGVVAVGDIVNTDDTLDIRLIGKLFIHSFIESIGFTERTADKHFEAAKKLYEIFASQSCNYTRQSIIPHAPYSVSNALFKIINSFQKESIISIHNQESEAENEYYQNKSGAIKELLQFIGVDDTHFISSSTTSLQTYMEWIDNSHPLLLVHNTFINKQDIKSAKEKFSHLFFCLCPNANLYIENKLPDVKMLVEQEVNICIGTDSLASNDALCILSELNTLHEQLNIDWELLLNWATFTGACSLQLDPLIGSFETGKKPGVLHIDPARKQVERII